MKPKQLSLLLLLTGLLFGYFFQLKWYYLILLLFIYLFFLKKITLSQKLQMQEYESFEEINSYMSQMSQSFVRTKNILSSLQETTELYPPGHMHTLLLECMDIILLEGGDISLAEQKALSLLEDNYPNERLHHLHEFMLLAETRGGDCKREFVLLEKMRIAWESALLKYYQHLITNRNLTSLLYILMLGVCVFVLHAFPDEFYILPFEGIQFTNFCLTIFFILCFFFMDRQLHGKLFRTAESFTKKSERSEAFTKWLFDLMLLIQRESVESAILHSISTAPPILKQELEQLAQGVLAYPGEITVFTSFLSEYHLPHVEMNMRKLYALSIGTDQKEDSIHFMIESNMDALMKAEEQRYSMKGDLSSLYQFLPLLLVSLGMLIYCGAIIFVSLSHIYALFE